MFSIIRELLFCNTFLTHITNARTRIYNKTLYKWPFTVKHVPSHNSRFRFSVKSHRVSVKLVFFPSWRQQMCVRVSHFEPLSRRRKNSDSQELSVYKASFRCLVWWVWLYLTNGCRGILASICLYLYIRYNVSTRNQKNRQFQNGDCVGSAVITQIPQFSHRVYVYVCIQGWS